MLTTLDIREGKLDIEMDLLDRISEDQMLGLGPSKVPWGPTRTIHRSHSLWTLQSCQAVKTRGISDRAGRVSAIKRQEEARTVIRWQGGLVCGSPVRDYLMVLLGCGNTGGEWLLGAGDELKLSKVEIRHLQRGEVVVSRWKIQRLGGGQAAISCNRLMVPAAGHPAIRGVEGHA